MEEFRRWILQERLAIDSAINSAAFTGELKVLPPFTIGALAIPLGKALGRWHEALGAVPLIYMIDEIENFSVAQQEVVNTLIRYGEGKATFRVSGRLYSMETFATLGNGEINREGAEFKVTNLDSIMRSLKGYPAFARRFVSVRLKASVKQGSMDDGEGEAIDPAKCFQEIDRSGYFSSALRKFAGDDSNPSTSAFLSALRQAPELVPVGEDILLELVRDFPAVIAKLNLLLFCKRYSRRRGDPLRVAMLIGEQAVEYLDGRSPPKSSYRTAYEHWANDLFAQICDESERHLGVPYAGFSSFIKMSSGNPRNLLVILGRAFDVAAFKEEMFSPQRPLSVQLQTEAVHDAANFIFDADTNFGSKSDSARQATLRLGNLLRTARYSLNIPEVSPLAVSLSESELSENSRRTLQQALNYSFVFEVAQGRPDRNGKRLNRKIQLNSLIAPKWQLPISRRGDISLNAELANAIFDSEHASAFEPLLRSLRAKWAFPFQSESQFGHPGLFE